MESKLPRYSSKLRETFHQINAYHISCTYKALFDDHALGVLRDLSDMEETNNESLVDPQRSHSSPQLASDGDISQMANHSMHSIEDELGPCGGRLSYNDYGRLSPGMHYKPDCQLLLSVFLRNSAMRTSSDAHILRDQIMEPWQTCSFCETEECEILHDVASASKMTLNGINPARSPVILNPLPFSSPPSAKDSSPRTKRLQLLPQTRHSDPKIKSSEECSPKVTKTRSAHDYLRKEDISYPFSHSELHLGHIIQYRENVTKANLQQGMRCVYQNQSHKDRFRMTPSSIMMDCEVNRWKLANHQHAKSGPGKYASKCPADTPRDKDRNTIIGEGAYEQIRDEQRLSRAETHSSMECTSSKFPKYLKNQTVQSDTELTPPKSFVKKKFQTYR